MDCGFLGFWFGLFVEWGNGLVLMGMGIKRGNQDCGNFGERRRWMERILFSECVLVGSLKGFISLLLLLSGATDAAGLGRYYDKLPALHSLY